MRSRNVFALALFSAAQLAIAQPPPCLLAAVNQQSNLADMQSMCGSRSSQVQQVLQSVCYGSDKSDALSAFADTCKDNGMTVSSVVAYDAPSSDSISASASGTKSLLAGDVASTTPFPSASISGVRPAGSANPSGSSLASVSMTNVKPVVVSSAHFDSSCNCSLTTSYTTSQTTAASATSAAAAGGSATTKASSTATGSTTHSGAAKANATGGANGRGVGSFAGLVVGVAGVVYLL